MPTQRFIWRFVFVTTMIAAAFWAGRVTAASHPSFSTGRVLPAGPLATTNANDDDPVPTDPLKLDYKTLRIANTLSARQIPFDLYTRANELAAFDLTADAGRLRESIRADLRNGVYGLATGADGWGVTTGLDVNALRQVSTYYASAPDPKLDARAKAWLAKYPPYSFRELAESQCEDSICTFARKASTDRR